MPKIAYASKTFSPVKADIIRKVNELVADYQRQGYRLTLRQVYYRFIAGDLFPESWIDPATGSKNNERSYKKLGEIVADGRMGGLIDWNAIEDRTRELAGVAHWNTPADIIRACHRSFRLDKWDTQPYRLEVWVEKDALEGIAKQAANGQDVAAFSCRGYGSLSSLWEAAQRLNEYVKAGQRPVIIHLGDHDPSGIDMTRDIEERLNTFIEMDWLNGKLMKLPAGETAAKRGDIWASIENHFREQHGPAKPGLVDLTNPLPGGKGKMGKPLQIRRVALNMDQVREYDPPPNPAKTTDSRFKGYQELYGDESWELDALEPSVLNTLITDTINEYRDDEAYAFRQEAEDTDRKHLQTAARNWNGRVVPLLDKLQE